MGITSFFIVHQFLSDVVFDTMFVLRESWKVASELLLVYFREIALDPTRSLHLGNVFKRGGQDTLLQQARQEAAVHFSEEPTQLEG